METPIKLIQSWGHIEDEIEPSDGRLVFRVQDYYINKDHFEKDNSLNIQIGSYFVGFKVRKKSTNEELSFVADYDTQDNEANIKVNLGSISNWPKVHGTDYLHVKIQYEYIDFWPIFEKRSTLILGTKIPPKNKKREFDVILPKEKIALLKLVVFQGYNGQYTMPGDSQGEISITVPLGMKIKDEGKKTKIIFYEGPVRKSTPQKEMSFRKPHITYHENKLKYHYIIDEKSYQYILNFVKKNLEVGTNLHFRYDVRNDLKFYLVFLFSLIFIFLTIIVNWDSHNWFYFIIIFLSFLTLYISLRKERFQIPFDHFIFVSIVTAPILLFLKLFILNSYLDGFLWIMLIFIGATTLLGYYKLK